MAQDRFEEEYIQRTSIKTRIFRGVVALAVIVGMVYFSGVYQYFFFQRTSPEVAQEPTEAAVDAETLTVPLVVFIVQSNESYGSARTPADAERLVEQADKVWTQASIDLEVEAIYVVEKSDKEIAVLYQDARAFAQTLARFDAGTLNVVLVGNLQGLNGVAFGGFPLLAVADYTSVYDFRVLAHEVGHKLGLSHVENEKKLMHQGANGFELSLQEIMTARELAKGFQ